MGKNGGSSSSSSSSSSWLSAVKRAFRSPTKDHENDHQKGREKRRWIFRKPTNNHHPEPVVGLQPPPPQPPPPALLQPVHLTRPAHSGSDRYRYAAVVIQTAFRGYLARRALRALKGVVKLQAVVRGHNVRKQANTTLQCMQALLRLQAQALDHRIRLSQRKSVCSSREGTSVADDWDERPHTVEEVKAMLQHRRDAALSRDSVLSHSFSQQMIWRTGKSPSIGNQTELDEEPKWLDQWMVNKPWEARARASMDHRPQPLKTLEIDTSRPYSYLAPENLHRVNYQTGQQHHPSQRSNSLSSSSPLHRAPHHHHQCPITPSPSRTRPIQQVRSASPRCSREDRNSHNITSQTPSLRSKHHSTSNNVGSGGTSQPNYMAATESAKARVRSQSVPRQRPATPERERAGTARKRLSFPVPPDPYSRMVGCGVYENNMRSPSFKSACGRYGGLEERSNYSSCYTESHGGEVSPSSTTDLRRWLR